MLWRIGGRGCGRHCCLRGIRCQRHPSAHPAKVDRGIIHGRIDRGPILTPLVRYARSVVVFDRQIGRSIQDYVGRLRVKEGFDRTIRLIAEVYTSRSRVQDRSIQIVTGLRLDREVDEQLIALIAWERELRRDYPTVQPRLDVRGELPRAQLEHDRYLITNQVTASVSRGFDLLYTNSQMRDQGLDPTRDARPIHQATVSLLMADTEALIKAEELEQLYPEL